NGYSCRTNATLPRTFLAAGVKIQSISLWPIETINTVVIDPGPVAPARDLPQRYHMREVRRQVPHLVASRLGDINQRSLQTLRVWRRLVGITGAFVQLDDGRVLRQIKRQPG